MPFNLSNIDFLPVLVASITNLAVEVLWIRFYKKNKKAKLHTFAIRFCSLAVFALGINLLCQHNDLASNLEESIWISLLFVAPSLGLQALDNKKSFTSWFLKTLYTIFQFALLSTITFGVVKLMSS